MAEQGTSNQRLPGVSVAISAYNYAKYLPDAINSVLQQDYPEFEVIVVDDGSTDNTAEVVAAFGNRIRYVHQKNAGLSAARNTGIREARFDYIAFLDADDKFLPQMLRKVMETMMSLPKEFAVVACGWSYMDVTGTDIKREARGRQVPLEFGCRDFIFKNRCAADAVVVKKEAFAECGGYDTTLRSSEDRDMWVRITARRRFYVLPDQLLRVRLHGNSMSRHAARMRNNGWRVISKAFSQRFVPRWNIAFWLSAISFLYFQAAWMYYDEGRPGRAIGQLLLSFILWPCFLSVQSLNEPVLFRLRSLARFTRQLIKT